MLRALLLGATIAAWLLFEPSLTTLLKAPRMVSAFYYPFLSRLRRMLVELFWLSELLELPRLFKNDATRISSPGLSQFSKVTILDLFFG